MNKLYFLLIVFLFPISIQAQDVIQSDRDALMALYNATDGPSWTNNTNWGTTELVGSWYGVTVDGDRVTKLSLFSNSLDGSIPAEIGDLTNLVELKLSLNQLQGNIPAEIGDLINLEWLWLHETELSGTIPIEIGKLINLRYLYLYATQLNGAIPAEIGNLTNLVQLYLYSNQLTGSIPTEIGNLVNLQSLDLGNNLLDGSIPSQIVDLPNLQSLNLGDNLLGGSIPSNIGNLTMLQSLDLHSNQLTANIPSGIGQLTDLELLWLAFNQLDGNIPSEIGHLVNLQYLWLDHNNFSNAVPNEFSQLASLQSLYLQNNQLDSLTDLSLLGSLSNCHIDNNYFDFGDLEIAGVKAINYYYDPQVQVEATRSVNNEQITFTLNVKGTDNTYQWYNMDEYINGAVDSFLTVSNTEDGAYWCSITNNDFPKLRLTSVVQGVGNSGVTHGVVNEEYDALIALYNNTDGDHWKDNTNWTSSELVSNWNGVTVSDIHVKKINLNKNELNGYIPKEIGNLTHLQGLYLSSNRLRGNIPVELGELIDLQAIILMNNNLKGAIPKEINQLANLSWLTLNDNEFDELPDLSTLSNLFNLKVQNNKLTFEDIEPNIIIGNGFDYSPQSLVGNVKYYMPENGDNISLNITIGGTANTYQWYKNNLAITDATNNIYTISSYDAVADSGVYVCEISNTIATDLILETRNYYVGVNHTTHNIMLSANPSISGTVGSQDDYVDGEEVTVFATANPGYRFANWTESGIEVSLDADYTFLAKSDRTLVANFEELVTGTTELNLVEDINVYPNPVQNILKIRIERNMQNANMYLFNLQGKLIFSRNYENILYGNTEQIDLSTYEHGMYILIIRSNSELVKSIKIIKE